MKKIEIKINNYKAIKSSSISLDDRNDNRLITIIGNNNSGKSTLLEAIAKLSNNPNIKRSELTNVLDDKGKIGPISEKPKISLSFLFKDKTMGDITLGTSIANDIFSETGLSKQIIEKKRFEYQDKIKLLEKTNYSSTGAFFNNVNTFLDDYQFFAFKRQVDSTGDKEASKIILEIRELLQVLKIRKQINVVPINSSNIFKYNKIDLDVLHNTDSNVEKEKQKLVLKEWEKILKINIQEFMLERSEEESSRNKKVMIEEFEKRANTLLKKMSKNLFGEVQKENLNIFFDFDDGTFNISWELNAKPGEGQVWVHSDSIEQTGSGIKSLWSIIFKIQSIDKSNPSIITIDEPEKYLNPLQQSYLLKYLKGISSKKSGRENQVIIFTTHSPFMIDLDLYQNTHQMFRDPVTNSSNLRGIYDVSGSDVPNLLLDKNLQMRYVESLAAVKKFSKVIFVEGISDYNVLSSMSDPDILWIPLFGNEYKKTLSFHYPYITSKFDVSKVKAILDDDNTGKEIKEWITNNINIDADHVKTYRDLEGAENLEEAIIKPAFDMKGITSTNNKKIDSLLFAAIDTNEMKAKFKSIIDFIKS